MSKLSNSERNFIKLLERSPDIGDGWREVSNVCKPMLGLIEHPDFFEIDESDGLKIRFSEFGKELAKYI